ncbi:MAG TPA: pirin family protein [Propionibacterium sp.]|nr:pirin family protein [Propionibacterium sp.]
MPAILQTFPLGTPWPGADPFLFAMHHIDHYPAANPDMSPRADLAGRQLGQDFANRDGWNMYHGTSVPGFPAHPHRGFETVTVVEEGLVDHADSEGAEARYGRGDTQWLTAGSGISHSEMFPLVNGDQPNTLHLFQIWLNLAPGDKSAPAHFTMLWANETPVVEQVGESGRTARVKVVAGAFEGHTPPPPPPASWAARPENHVAIWHAELEAGATLTLPPADSSAVRTIYVYDGSLDVDGRILNDSGAVIDPSTALPVTAATDSRARFLLLQGRPIGAPVVQHGPFVGNTREDVIAAFTDYQNGVFGQWIHPTTDPVHDREQGRFARYPDGTVRSPHE